MSGGVTIKLDGAAAALAAFDKAALARAFSRGLLSASQRAVHVLTVATQRAKAVGVTGLLAATWRGDVEEGLPGSLGGSLVLTNPQPYFAVVEEGRRPGTFPPLEPLRMWVRRKLRVRAGKGRRGKAGSTMSPRKRAEMRAAYAIGLSIKAHGTPGRHILARTMPKIADVAAREVADEIIAGARTSK